MPGQALQWVEQPAPKLVHGFDSRSVMQKISAMVLAQRCHWLATNTAFTTPALPSWCSARQSLGGPRNCQKWEKCFVETFRIQL